MAGTRNLVIMAVWHTQRQVEREERSAGWLSLWCPTRQIRRVKDLSIEGSVRSPTWRTVIDGRPARMPQEAHFRTPGPESADPCFPPKNADLMYTGFNGHFQMKRVANSVKLPALGCLPSE